MKKTMSKEKQIEEMAREMCHLSAECKTCQICNERYHGDDDDLCYFQCVAKEIINHGYRKQSEDNVEVVRCKDCEYWNPMDNGISWHNKGRTDGECDMLYRVHCAERHLTEQDHFCSYAKMKGGAE